MDLAQNRTRVGTHCVSLDDAVDTSSCAQLRTSLSLWSTLALLLALRRRFALRDGRDARPT